MTSEELFNQFDWRVTLDTAPLPDGRIKKSVRVHRNDSVHIIAFKTPGTILMLREFRAFYGEYIWMLPSGKADKEADLLVAAHRELREETGFDAKDLKKYCTGNLSDSIVITNHIYVGHGLFESPLEQDHDELIEVHEMPFDEAIQKVLTSSKVHMVSAYGLLRYAFERR